MKSRGIINILFLFLSINIFANFNLETIQDYDKQKKMTDSLYLSQNQMHLYEKDAKAIIDSYKKAINEGIVLVDDDLKRMAISYSTLNDAPKSTKYLEEYIKKSHDFNVVESRYFEKISKSNEFLILLKKYKPKFNFWFMINFYIGLIGIFIAIVLNLKKDGDRVANLLISLFILFTALFIIHIWVFISNVQYNFPHTLFATISFNFLYAPLLYFYFKRTTIKHKFRLKDALHLVPFVITTIYFFKYFILSSDAKLHILLNNRDQSFDHALIYVVIFKIISLVVYGFLIYKMYRKTLKSSSIKNTIILKWQRNIVTLNSFYVFSHVLYVLMVTGLLSMNFLIHPQIISMSLMVLYVGYVAYVQPKVLSKNNLDNELLKYQKSGLTEGFSNDLKEQLIKLLNEDKIYKMNDINLETLSQMIGTTRHNISQVINEHFDMNFFKLVNKYRIEEAEYIFKNDLNNNLNIIDVAYDVGFNNKVTFNKAFKEQTNSTPSEYLKDLKHQNIGNYKVNLR